ncbi:MAG: hypothetical protein ACSNEK_10215 [Parachlamydiaceae bacterium]
MKKKSLLTVLITLSMCCESYGMENKQEAASSYQKYEKEITDSIQGNGSIILEDAKVVGPVIINGSLQAAGSVIGNLQVNGQVDLKDCLINHATKINGSIFANNTEFQQELSVSSKKITLTACSVNSLTVRKVSGYDGIQTIDLRSGTKVTGPIFVESGKVEIWLSSNSEISDQVCGAKVFRK